MNTASMLMIRTEILNGNQHKSETMAAAVDLRTENTGQAFTGSFDEAGIHLASADGSISGQGQFIHGTNATAMAGSGQFSGFGAIFNDDCGRTCVAKGSTYPLDPEHSFSDLLSAMIKNPGAEAMDFFHPGHANYHFDNGDGPSPHIPYAPGLPYQELHYDAEYPYADIGASAGIRVQR